MDTIRKKPLAVSHNDTTESERRRIGRIVHDDRGNATVDWRDAPSDYKRQVLEVEEQPGVLSVKKVPRTFDPYSCATPVEPQKSAAPKKDLKKLSEWIKLMRDLEERKRSGEME